MLRVFILTLINYDSHLDVVNRCPTSVNDIRDVVFIICILHLINLRTKSVSSLYLSNDQHLK